MPKIVPKEPNFDPLFEVVADSETPGVWRVEHIRPDGEVWVILFSGTGAEQRARDYAWLGNNSNW